MQRIQPSLEVNDRSRNQEISRLYGTRMFTIVSTKAATSPYPESDASSPRSSVLSVGTNRLRFNVNFPPKRLCLPSSAFPPDFPSKILFAFLASAIRAPRSAYPTILQLHHPNSICWRAQITMPFIMQRFQPSDTSSILRPIFFSISHSHPRYTRFP